MTPADTSDNDEALRAHVRKLAQTRYANLVDRADPADSMAASIGAALASRVDRLELAPVCGVNPPALYRVFVVELARPRHSITALFTVSEIGTAYLLDTSINFAWWLDDAGAKLDDPDCLREAAELYLRLHDPIPTDPLREVTLCDLEAARHSSACEAPAVQMNRGALELRAHVNWSTEGATPPANPATWSAWRFVFVPPALLLAKPLEELTAD